MLSKKLAIEVLNAGLATGADYAELFVEDSRSESISLEQGKTETCSSNIVSGVGIRLLKDLRSVYGSTSDLSRKNLVALATELSKSFNGTRIKEVKDIKKVKVKQRNDYSRPSLNEPKEKKIALLKEGYKVISDYDSHIVRIISMFSSSIKKIQILTSEGKETNDERQYGQIAFLGIAMKDGQIEQAFEARRCQQGFEFFENLNIEEIAKEVGRVTIQNLNAKECPSGKMPVVVGNGWGGVLFHESCGHPLEATAVAKNLSVFANSIGKQIANPVVTAVDDATLPNVWGSINYDDEGNPGEKTVLIKDGILQDYLVDDFNGRRMGRKGNGSSRRQNFSFEPTSRMTNTYIDNGKSTPEEVIQSIKLGLYTKAFAGGSVNPATGEFNFACSEAYIIRDGKIAEPVKGATLIGTGKEILQHIDMVANDLALGEGMCGSSSGTIPVCVGQPTLRINEVTVGGRGGKLQ